MTEKNEKDDATILQGDKIYPFSLKPEWLIFFAYLFILILLADYRIQSFNVATRLNTIDSLVRKGTFEWVDAPFFTFDRIKVDGRLHSDKPPVFQFFGAIVYAPLYAAFRWDMSFNTANIIYCLVIVLVAVPSSFMMYFFYKALRLVKVEKYALYLILIFAAFGTIFFSYSTHINNHTVGGALLFIGFYFLLKEKYGAGTPAANASLCGLFSGLSATIDIPTGGIFTVLFLFYFVLTGKGGRMKSFLWFAAGAAGPFLLHCILQYRITGGILPAQAYKKYYIFEGAYDFSLEEETNLWKYPFNYLFFKVGLFSYSPALLFSVAGIVCSLRKRSNEFFKEALLVAIGVTSVLIFYFFFDTWKNYCGVCYGPRYFIPFMPLMIFCTYPLFRRRRSALFYCCFIALLLYSIFIATCGIEGSPWYYITRKENPLLNLFFMEFYRLL